MGIFDNSSTKMSINLLFSSNLPKLLDESSENFDDFSSILYFYLALLKDAVSDWLISYTISSFKFLDISNMFFSDLFDESEKVFN